MSFESGSSILGPEGTSVRKVYLTRQPYRPCESDISTLERAMTREKQRD